MTTAAIYALFSLYEICATTAVLLIGAHHYTTRKGNK